MELSDDARAVSRRSGKRFERKFRVRIKGADARGLAFEEWVKTLNVSEQGLALLTGRDLAHSSHLTVCVPRRGTRSAGGRHRDFVAQAIVAYVLPDGELYRVGLRFIAATLELARDAYSR